MEDEQVIDFNFWPSFADLMLAVVLILVLIIFLVIAVISAGAVNLSHVKQHQNNLVKKIAGLYGDRVRDLGSETTGISTDGTESNDLIIKNEPTLQRITFSDKVLFFPDRYELNRKGEDLLGKVGEAIKQQLSDIKEIQIQGHADTIPTSVHGSNSRLAALRAIEVFEFLQRVVHIDPAEHLMSATSFGEFKPVQRTGDEATYDAKLLQDYNSTSVLRGRNRRIELLLFYRI